MIQVRRLIQTSNLICRTQFIFTTYTGLQCLSLKINYSNLCIMFGTWEVRRVKQSRSTVEILTWESDSKIYISLIGLSLDEDGVLGKNWLVLAVINAREGIIFILSKVVNTTFFAFPQRCDLFSLWLIVATDNYTCFHVLVGFTDFLQRLWFTQKCSWKMLPIPMTTSTRKWRRFFTV